MLMANIPMELLWFCGKQGGMQFGDVTVTDSMAFIITYLPSMSVIVGIAAEIAPLYKEVKSRKQSVTHNFVPKALDILGPFGSKALAFLWELGHRLTRATEDLRKNAFLFQRFSEAVQR